MNKRSAIVTAGGLTASFVAGVAAVASNWGLGAINSETVAATPSASAKATKPRIRHRTIVVHKKAPGSPPSERQAGPRTITLPASGDTTSAPVATTGGSHVIGGEHDDAEHDDGESEGRDD